MTYFLTGATGFLGGVIARELRRAGHGVRALVRRPDRADALARLGVELHQGDVTDKASMRVPMARADAVFHVAGWYKFGVNDPVAAAGTNVDGTRHVLELMKELGIPKGVYTSTLAVNSDTHGQVVDENYRFTGRDLSLYDRTKGQAHRIAEEFIAGGLPLVIVQPGVIYGPGDTSSIRTMLVRFLQRKLPVLPSGSAYCWTHVEDQARGHLLAMDRGALGRNYFLAGPAHTMIEAVSMASSITGIRAPRLHVPAGLLKSMSLVVKPIERFVKLPPEYTAEGLRVAGGVTYLGRSARAQQELGWRFRPLRDGLVETLRHEMRSLGMRPTF
jgi:nucleoside-diphosphate-sugar epimerase